MPKTTRIKSDLDNITELVEILSILKDVASSHFFGAAKIKARFGEFALAFTEFFRMISLSNATSPLVSNDIPNTGILAVSSEGGFMAEMTIKIAKTAVAEAEKLGAHEFIVAGAQVEQKLRLIFPNAKMTVFTNIEEKGPFKTAIEIKDFIIDQVEQGKLGKVYAVYPRAKSLNLIKPTVTKMLPSEELITKQQGIKDTVEKVIVESDPNDIINYLAGLWLTCRIFEMLEDAIIASYAAQSQHLESSLERLKKEKKGLVISFKKAQKSDIDQSLREVFTSSLMTKGGRR
ncbi:F0F1 ATP synthase subunit gamma [Candidatus Omnitrophota bacterium]